MSASTLKPAAAPGWYGKLPSRGDFAGRRLPAAFVRRWDDWLQQGLAEARARHGAAWLDRYLVAPVWRCWLSPGVMGGAWRGVLMPSVDAVGRHFPLTLALPAAGLADTLAGRAAFDALEAVARRVLDVSFEVADLERALAAFAPGDPPADAADQALAAALLRPHALPGGGLRGCSVWWRGAAGPATAFRCVEDLPAAALLLAPQAVEAPTPTGLLP